MRIVGIDPSTRTGLLIMDIEGNVITQEEIKGIGSVDPYRMITMIDSIMSYMQKGDFVVIEGFGFASQQAVQNGGQGWGIRMALARRGIEYKEVAPNALKKFVGVTGWTGKVGDKVKLQGAAVKQAVIDGVNKHYGVHIPNNNICDAYVLAQIGRAIKLRKVQHDYQKEVIMTILNPPVKKKKAKNKRGQQIG